MTVTTRVATVIIYLNARSRVRSVRRRFGFTFWPECLHEASVIYRGLDQPRNSAQAVGPATRACKVGKSLVSENSVRSCFSGIVFPTWYYIIVAFRFKTITRHYNLAVTGRRQYKISVSRSGIADRTLGFLPYYAHMQINSISDILYVSIYASSDPDKLYTLHFSFFLRPYCPSRTFRTVCF